MKKMTIKIGSWVRTENGRFLGQVANLSNGWATVAWVGVGTSDHMIENLTLVA